MYGLKLKEQRAKQGLTLAEAAKLLGVSDRTVMRWENNQSSPPLNLLPNLIDIYKLTKKEILAMSKKEAI